MFSQFVSDYWVYFLLPLLVGVCLSVVDLRILIAVLMLVFVAVPFIMLLLYFYYMLTDSMVWSVSEKTITLNSDNSITLEFENPKLHSVQLHADKIIRAFSYKQYTLLQVEENRFRFLVIPDEAFDREGDKTLLINCFS